MKYSSLAAFLFCLAHSVANAQPMQIKKPVLCDKTSTVLRVLEETFQETPAWGGNNSRDNASYALMLNPKTKTWTLVQFDADIACVLGVGDDYIVRQM